MLVNKYFNFDLYINNSAPLDVFTLQGENRFIESICQTIFKVDELIDILTNRDIENNLKRPYLRFFLWVYLNTAGGMIESGAGELPHDEWDYMNDYNKLLGIRYNLNITKQSTTNNVHIHVFLYVLNMLNILSFPKFRVP